MPAIRKPSCMQKNNDCVILSKVYTSLAAIDCRFRFIQTVILSGAQHHICHPERSAAESKDLSR